MVKIATTLDWEQGELAEGLTCYRNCEFFETHEHWEIVWLRTAEPEKAFLQSLIQIAAAFHHLRRGNPIGAASLLRRARRRLESYPATFGALDVTTILQSVQVWLEALDAGDFSPELSFPVIR